MKVAVRRTESATRATRSVSAEITGTVRAAGLGAAGVGDTAASAETEGPGTQEDDGPELEKEAAAEPGTVEETGPEPVEERSEQEGSGQEAPGTEETAGTDFAGVPGREAVAARKGRVASVVSVALSDAGEGRTLAEIGRAATRPALVEMLLPADGSATVAMAAGLLPPSASLMSRAARVTASVGGD
jgi:hypothetical protein